MRISKHMLYDSIAAARFRIGEAVERAIALRVLDAVIQVALLLVAECFAVADEKLKIARIGMIDVRIINLVDDPMAKREPKPATAVVSRAHALLCAGSPARLDSRRSKRYRMAGWIHQGAHPFQESLGKLLGVTVRCAKRLWLVAIPFCCRARFGGCVLFTLSP